MMFVFGLDRGGVFAFGGDPLRQAVQARASEVLADAAGSGPESREESLPVEAAVACGYCRLFCGEPPRVAFPDRLAGPAAERLRTLIEACTGDAGRLPERWDAASAEQASDLVADLLEARMDSWAALETLRAAGSIPGLSAAVEAIETSLGRFDTALSERADFLATLAHTQLLANWRLALAAPHRDPFPWWLDGILEATAVDVDRAIRSMERELFGPREGVVERVDRFAAVRDRIAPACALAADVPPSGPTLAPLLVWHSPDGQFTARLLPPPGGLARGGRLVVEFLPHADDADTTRLRGCVAVLGGRGLPIDWRTVDGEDMATVHVPSAVVVEAMSSGDDEAAALVVMPDGGTWRVVTSTDEPNAGR